MTNKVYKSAFYRVYDHQCTNKTFTGYMTITVYKSDFYSVYDHNSVQSTFSVYKTITCAEILNKKSSEIKASHMPVLFIINDKMTENTFIIRTAVHHPTILCHRKIQ